jgi:hypothetical protein
MKQGTTKWKLGKGGFLNLTLDKLFADWIELVEIRFNGEMCRQQIN